MALEKNPTATTATSAYVGAMLHKQSRNLVLPILSVDVGGSQKVYALRTVCNQELKLGCEMWHTLTRHEL